MDSQLENLGVHHKKQQEIILKNIVSDQDFSALNFLVDFLHEGAFANRLSLYQPTLYTSTPLDGIVDAASAESYPAYEFNKKVTEYLDTGDAQLKKEIQILLQKWIDNHNQLINVFNTNEKVKLIQDHSKNLSVLSTMALKITEGKELSENDKSSLKELFQSAEKEYGGTVLAVVPGLEILIRSAG
jgi:hypothetical protein